MPTASIKAEKVKQPSLEANDPLRQGITIVEHKIRNLEKRKTKLDSYRSVQATGKELNSDQLNAIQKYDEVIQTLEFARDLCKQLNTLAAESAKVLKKQLRKEAAEKVQQEIARTREILIIQDVLSSMGQDQVREELVEGKAKVTLTTEELAQIDQLYLEISPKQEETPAPYLNQFQSPAEHMSALIDGKSKEAFGTTYAALKTKLMDIANSGYFDPAQVEQPPSLPVAAAPGPVPVPSEEVAQEPSAEIVAEPAPEIVTTSIAPSETGMPAMQEVSQLESQLIQQQQAAAAAQHHLSVFKSGPIDFIQENEVEEPEEDNSIPTLTYTNQNYTPNKTAPTAAVEQPPEDQWGQDTLPPPVDRQPPVTQQMPPTVSHQEDDGWDESGDSGWQEANHWHTQSHHHNQQQSTNDGFIQAGGGRGRGGRGRGGRGGPNRSQQPRPNTRGGYREGAYNREGGQNYYQNGYRGGGADRRGGGNRNYPDRGGGGRGGSGPRGARGVNNNYRGGYRQQQQ